MLQGLYAAASGMEAQQTQMNAISNDLANLNTPGYQATEVGFENLLYSAGGSSSGTTVATGTGASAQFIGRSQAQGSLQHTGRSLDVAIEGEGYLEVRRADGSTGLTRDGALQINAQGQLTNGQGQAMLPPITIPKGTDPSKIAISANGTVSVGGRSLGRLALVTVPSPNNLLADGNSQFTATAASGATRPAAGASLQQGSLEGSNVDIADAMSQMIVSERGYQMASKAIQYQDQMLQIANQVKK